MAKRRKKKPRLEIGPIEQELDPIELDVSEDEGLLDLTGESGHPMTEVLPVLELLLSRTEKNKTLKKKDRKLLRQFAAAQKVANRR